MVPGIAHVTTACASLIVCAAAENRDLKTESEQETPQPAVAATVNGVPILVADVNLRVRQTLGDKAVTDQARPLLQAAALEWLIKQQQVLVQLERRGKARSQTEVDSEMRRLKQTLASQEKTIDDHCQSLDIPHSSLRRMLRWQLSWERCRSGYLTDENLQRYFDRHRKEFDGTRMRVAQVLLRSQDDSDHQTLVQQAREIRGKIVSGEISFAQAARKYSLSPSSSDGGQLGWISRQAPMPEFFSKAAYQLDEGEVSEPVESRYGVHLIKCLEIEPGQKDWRDVHGALSNAASEFLFRWLAERPEPEHDVRYTGKSPHFKPGTRQLAGE